MYYPDIRRKAGKVCSHNQASVYHSYEDRACRTIPFHRYSSLEEECGAFGYCGRNRNPGVTRAGVIGIEL